MNENLKKLGWTLAAAVVAAFGTALGAWASERLKEQIPVPKPKRKKK